jgi:hypothetical protein
MTEITTEYSFRVHELCILVIYISQPLLYIRLSAYSRELTRENIKGLGSSPFARHY